MAALSTSCGRAQLLVRSARPTTTTLSSAAAWRGSRWVSLLGDFPGEEGMGYLSCFFFSPTEDDLCVARTKAMRGRRLSARAENHHLQNYRFLAESGHLCGHLHCHPAHRPDLLLLEKESKVHDDGYWSLGMDRAGRRSSKRVNSWSFFSGVSHRTP